MDLSFRPELPASPDLVSGQPGAGLDGEIGLAIFREFFLRPDALLAEFDAIPQMMWISGPDGLGHQYNQLLLEFVEGPSAAPRDPTRTFDFTRHIHPDDYARLAACWREARTTGTDFELDLRLRHHSGEYRWLLSRARPRRDRQGQILRWYGTLTEVHEKVVAEQHLQEVRNVQNNLLQASSDCIKILELDGTLRQINDYGVNALQLDSREAVIGTSWCEFWPARARRSAQDAVRNAAAGRIARFSGQCFTANGEECWWDNVLTPIKDAHGTPQMLLCISRNITNQRRAAEKLRFTSEHDDLTNLPNRRSFERHLKYVISAARDSGGKVGLMLLDLDYFKHLNDTLGHLAGDHLLRTLARRLRTYSSPSSFVARLGGDEFAIIVSGNCSEQDLLELASDVHFRAEEAVTFGGHKINGGLSIGCAMYPRDATSARELFKLADTALYDLKAGGRGGVRMFNRQIMDLAQRTATELSMARRAIQDDLIVPHYQPKVDLRNGKVFGFEALLRWTLPGYGLQGPAALASGFNDYELATKIGIIMQDRVLTDLASWRAMGLEPGSVSINAAPVEFLRDDYAERLLGRIAHYQVPPTSIEVEVTEHGLLERSSRYVSRALEALKQAGVRIALDDFGTGNASLTHLQEFPVDTLKLDRSFVTRMMSDPETLAIVQAVTRLGPSLSIDIIAEGIESFEQFCTLKDAGCNFGQGYLFGRAMPASEIVDRLRHDRWAFKGPIPGG